MQLGNITTIFKNKNPRLDMSKVRGLTGLRQILDKLAYSDFYPHMDGQMSDSNIGSRKNKMIINHLFVLYGIINSVMKGEGKCTDIQIYNAYHVYFMLGYIMGYWGHWTCWKVA